MNGSSGRGALLRLLAALAVSQVGSWLYNVALLAVVYQRTHSATWLAVTTAARIVPIVVCGPLGGIVADRWNRRRVMITSDSVQAATMLALAAVASAGWPIALAPALAAVATLAASPYPSCVAASMPRLVDPDRLARANGARSAIGSASIVIGPALGGLLLAVASPTAAFVANGVSFAVSALVVASIRHRDAFRPAVPDAVPHLVADLAAGLRALRGSRTALRLVGADVSCSLVYGAETVLFVLLVRAIGLGMDGYGWMLAATGAGGVIGAVVAPRLTGSARPRQVLAGALLTVAVPLFVFAVTSSAAVAIVLAALGGAGAIVVEVLADTGLQQCLDEEVLGRAYGLALTAALGGIVLGSVIAAPLAALLGVRGALLALGALVIVHALVLALRPRVRKSRPEEEIAMAPSAGSGSRPVEPPIPVAANS